MIAELPFPSHPKSLQKITKDIAEILRQGPWDLAVECGRSFYGKVPRTLLWNGSEEGLEILHQGPRNLAVEWAPTFYGKVPGTFP